MSVHVRRPLRRRGGSSFYRDRSERTPATYCGEPVTAIDCQAQDVDALVREAWPVCAGCLELLENKS